MSCILIDAALLYPHGLSHGAPLQPQPGSGVEDRTYPCNVYSMPFGSNDLGITVPSVHP